MVDPAKIAEILLRLHRLGPIRRTPEPDDLSGEFEAWFDGGAFRSVTGATTYAFADGSEAIVGVQPWLSLSIRLVDGTEVSVIERQRHSQAQVCAGCGGELDPAITHQVIDGRAFHMGCAA
ncbi:MAG TPA: hypothetical protein VN259_03080 [Xanthomonadales bacterium]|nr:hypothetical protein [Xanthomonadales bacterium]